VVPGYRIERKSGALGPPAGTIGPVRTMMQPTSQPVTVPTCAVSAARRRLRVPFLLVIALPFLGVCSASTGSLKGAVDDEPRVIRVRVEESDGDSNVPFARVPKYVTVWMDSDAASEEVMAVFDAYDDEIDDGDVGSVDVILDGPKRATLSSGEGIHVTVEMVDELVDAQHDDAVLEYRREAYPVLPSVSLVLAPTDFGGVVAVADGYRDAEGIEVVNVVSGDFYLSRDEVNENHLITTAREELVHLVGSRFQLRGAVVSGRGPLELIVAPADEEAVRRFVARDPVAGPMGSVVVEASRRHAS